MKKIFIFFATVASVIFASCNKEYVAQDTPSTEKITRITASIPDTKTYLDGLQLKWSEGDKIWVASKLATNQPTAFVLTEGENTTTGVFEGKDAITAPYYAFSGNWYGWVFNKFFFDFPREQGYVENSISKPLIPMYVSGATGSEATFKHLASVLRFDVTVSNELGTIVPVGIKLNTLGDTYFSKRVSINFNTGELDLFANYYSEVVLTNIPQQLQAGKTTTFYFVVPAQETAPVRLQIIDNNANIYSVTKASSMSLERGKMYKFPVATISTPDIADFLVKIDSEDWKPYNEMTDLSGATNRIAFKDNPAAEPKTIGDPFLSTLKKQLKSCNNTAIEIDLSALTWGTNILQSPGFKNFGNVLGWLYLPTNITTILGGSKGDFGKFSGNSNLKLYIHEGLNTIESAAIFIGGFEMNEGCGVFVDPNNSAFASYDGSLYSKNGTRLYCVPPRDTSVVVRDGTKFLEDYAIANNTRIRSCTLPASWSESYFAHTFTFDSNLKEVIYKREVKSTAEVSITANGLPQNCGTSPRYFRVPQSSLTYYQEALAGQLNGWTLVGYQEE